jgi:hypothetical protein
VDVGALNFIQTAIEGERTMARYYRRRRAPAPRFNPAPAPRATGPANVRHLGTLEQFMADVHERFATEADAVSFCKRNYLSGYEADRHWNAGVGWAESVRRTIEGDTSLVAQAQEWADKFEADVDDAQRKTYVNAVSGSSVRVAAFLSGDARCMRKRVRDTAASRVVRIFVNIASSAGIASDALLKRGAAILGLVQALQARGVTARITLVLNHESNANVYTIDVDTTPVDLSTAGFAMAHPAFARNILYPMLTAIEGSVSAWNGCGDGAKFMSELLEPSDIYVPRPGLGDPMMSDPEQWVRDRVRQIFNVEQCDEGNAGY